MVRFTGVVAAVVAFGLGVGGFAKSSKAEDPADPSKGAKLSSRIPCDGVTNPEDQVNLIATFSQGDWAREFRIQVFESKYCKLGDLGFTCLRSGRGLWKPDWIADSSQATVNGTYGISSCGEPAFGGAASLGAGPSNEAPQILLTGWYKEGSASDRKLPWKQAPIKQAQTRWETYEFTDSNGATAKLEIDRR